MGQYKEITNLKLEDCCIKTLIDIERRENIGRWLSGVMLLLVFVNLFIGPSKAELKTLYDIRYTDWTLLANAVSSIPGITRRAILNEIIKEQMLHDGKLRHFWDGTFDAFSQ